MVKSPAMIHKLGHFGYETDNYEDTCSWYTKHFNFRPTDVLHAPGNETTDVGTFFRLDLGQEYVDHHCLLLVRGHKAGTRIHHSSFEVEDLDTQFMGKLGLTKTKPASRILLTRFLLCVRSSVAAGPWLRPSLGHWTARAWLTGIRLLV